MRNAAFTPQQTANGILTTFARGDYSVAAARLKDIQGGHKRQEVLALVRDTLSKEEWTIFARYLRDIL